MAKHISVLGGGTWGTALAVHLSKKQAVSVWEFSKERVDFVNKNHSHDLLDADVPKNVLFSHDISMVKEADVIVLAVPSNTMQSTIKSSSAYLKKNAILVCASKGFAPSGETLYEMLAKETKNQVAVISGPTHAEEVVLGKPCGVVIAAHEMSVARELKELFETEHFIVETSTDPIGVQLSASVKNVLAVLVGVVGGMKLGDNAEALALTKGFHQLSKLVILGGGKLETYFGLAGLGDVVVTCLSEHSRNRSFGTLIGEGKSAKDALAEIGQVVEGLNALKILKKTCDRHKLNIPIIYELDDVVEKGASAKVALHKILSHEI